MQRLEVSGAVRPIYGSLGLKRLSDLIKCTVQRKMTKKQNISKMFGYTLFLSDFNET